MVKSLVNKNLQQQLMLLLLLLLLRVLGEILYRSPLFFFFILSQPLLLYHRACRRFHVPRAMSGPVIVIPQCLTETPVGNPRVQTDASSSSIGLDIVPLSEIGLTCFFPLISWETIRTLLRASEMPVPLSPEKARARARVSERASKRARQGDAAKTAI